MSVADRRPRPPAAREEQPYVAASKSRRTGLMLAPIVVTVWVVGWALLQARTPWPPASRT